MAGMTTVQDFQRLATPGSRWEWTGPRIRRATCTITHLQGTLPRFRGVRDDGGTFTGARLDLPPADYLAVDGDTLHVLFDSRDPGAIAASWRYLGHQDGPPHQPAVDPATVRACRVDRLQPGDVVYGPARTYDGRRPGYTVTDVDLTTTPATITTAEDWPLYHAPWQLLAVAPSGDVDRCEPVPDLPAAGPARVYLGVNNIAWLARPDMADVPKCVSRNRLAGYRGRRIPRSLAPVLLDSGGFTELKQHGRWRLTPAEYVAEVRRLVDEIGPERVVAIAQQDWMCEDEVIEGGHTKDGTFVGTRQHLDPDRRLTLDDMVREHQRLTVANFVELRRLAPDLPIIPVIQGKTRRQYLRHLGMFVDAGVGFLEEPLVGLGSVCRRQGTQETGEIVRAVAGYGLRLHGFGVGVQGLSLYGNRIASSDSNAWSYDGRRSGACPHGVVKWEGNCPVRARAWWDGARARLANPRPPVRPVARRAVPEQLALFPVA